MPNLDPSWKGTRHARAVLSRTAILVTHGVLSLTCAGCFDDTPGSQAARKGVTRVKTTVAWTSLDVRQDGPCSADLRADAERRCGLWSLSSPNVSARHDHVE